MNGNPKCLCGHPHRRHRGPSVSLFTHEPLPRICLEYGCECRKYRPPMTTAAYRDGDTAIGAGHVGRMLHLIEQGRFE